MPLNFDNLRGLDEKVVASLETVFAGMLDSDNYLDGRDKPPFDKDWADAFERVEQEKANLSKKEMKLLNARVSVLRELIFKLVIRVTKKTELAGYISDDFGLIFDALALNLNDAWIQTLLNQYLAGRLPQGSVSQN